MWLYSLGIRFFVFAVSIVARFNPKARLWVDGRRDIFRRLQETIDPEDSVVWVHSASLGEFEQGRPIIEAVRDRYPNYKILLTFFSPSGYEIRKNYQGADYIFYLPADTPCNAKRFIEIVRPRVAIFVKYEFWLNYLLELKDSGCRTFIVSAIFRPNSIFFKWYGSIFRSGLRCFERIFVQNEGSKELLHSIGIESVTVAGDTRFDRVADIAKMARRIDVVERFANGSRVFVAGSTWPPDEQIIAQAIEGYPRLKFIIAPHEMDIARIEKFVAESSRKAVRYTECTSQTDLAEAQVLVIDTIGILSSVYQYADYAYIGGGFGVGIHNTLEAATFGLPITFGPNYLRFKEACDMIEIGVARSVDSFEQLDIWLQALEKERAFYHSTRATASNYIAENRGATSTVLSLIFPQSH